MFSKIRNVLSGSSSDTNSRNFSPSGKSCLSPKFPYSRPHFLALSEDQVQASADHRTRPIITPNHGMSFFTGYAECINAGKSKWNEDQAVSHHGILKSGNFVMPYKFYALFDGHAGVGASICAANQMHHVVHERLVDTQDDIWTDFRDTADPKRRNLLVIGALEAAFKEMDDIIKGDRVTLQSSGGCTAIVAIFLLGQLFVANAGDSRAIVCKGCGFQAMSTDFTPESDRSRIRQLAQTKPELLGNDFTYMEYIRQPRVNDLGKIILYRDAFMTGWAHKTIAPEDLKISIISGQGKRSRVMGTIGVTRGFGDHELVSVHQKVPIKPFLSCHPEVKVYNLTNCSSYDVLVMGTDGLWDVVDGHTVTQIVNYALDNFPKKEMCPTAAACLVGAARGSLKENCWMMKSGKLASVDDISVFVIPLYPCSHLTYKIRKQMPTEEENDCGLMGDVKDDSSVEEIPGDSTTSLGSASSDDYSLLIHTRANVPKVTISGISLSESNKSKIILQGEDVCEDEEIEGEIDEPLSTDVDTEDVDTDENAANSNRSSDQTLLIAKSHDEKRRDFKVVPVTDSFGLSDDDQTIVLQDVGQLSGTSSETPLVSYTTEATSQVRHERTEPCDESSEDELILPDQRPHARRFKKDFMNLMREKQRQRGIHNVPFQYSVDTYNREDSDSISGPFNTLTIDSEQQRNVRMQSSLGAENNTVFEAQGDAAATLESHIKMQREYQYLSDRNLDSTQSRNVKDTQKIVMETYVSTDSKSQYVIQQTTKTEAIVSRKDRLRDSQNPYNDTDSSSPVSALFIESSSSISEDAPFTPGRESESASTITEDTPPIITDSSISSSDIDLLEPVTSKRFVSSNVPAHENTFQRQFTEKPVEDRGIRYYDYPKHERKTSPPFQKYHRDGTPQMRSMFMVDPFNVAVQKQKLYSATQTVSDRSTYKPKYIQGSLKSPEDKLKRGNIQSLEPMHKTEVLKSPEFIRKAVKTQSPEPMRKIDHTQTSRSPDHKQRAADTRSLEPMHKTEHIRVSKSPKYKHGTADTRSPEPRRRTEHSRVSRSPEYKHGAADTQSPETRRRTEHTRVSRSPEYKHGAADTQSPETGHRTEHTRVSRSPEYKLGAADTQSPETRRRTEHTRVSRSPEYKHGTADTRSPASRHRTEHARVSHSPNYMREHERSPERTTVIKTAQQPSFMYQIETNPERMRQLQMLKQVSKQQEWEKHARKLMSVRSMSPPPQVRATYRNRTNSFPPCEMVKPGASRRAQQVAYKKQYSQSTPTTSHEVKVSPHRKQEHVATTHREQTVPPEILAAEQEIRAHRQYSGIVKPVSKSKSKPKRAPKDVLEEAKWEFYSDYDESDDDPQK